MWQSVSAPQTEDVFKETAAVHVVVLCLLRGLALLPPPEPQQLLLYRSSVSLWSRDAQELIFITSTNILYVKYCTNVDVWVLVTFSQEPGVRRPAALPASHSTAAHHPLSQTTSCVRTDDSGDVLLLRLSCSMSFSSASAAEKKKKKTQRKGSGVTPLWTVKLRHRCMLNLIWRCLFFYWSILTLCLSAVWDSKWGGKEGPFNAFKFWFGWSATAEKKTRKTGLWPGGCWLKFLDMLAVLLWCLLFTSLAVRWGRRLQHLRCGDAWNQHTRGLNSSTQTQHVWINSPGLDLDQNWTWR